MSEPMESKEKAPEEEKEKSGRLKALFGLLCRCLFLLVTVYVLFFHIVGLTQMPNSDMYPRLDAGDRLLYYRLDQTIKAQSVVVFRKPRAELIIPDGTDRSKAPNYVAGRSQGGYQDFLTGLSEGISRFDRAVKKMLGRPLPEEDSELFVCRVVATAGDKVEISDSERLVVNGNTMIEANIFYNTPEYAGFVEYPVVLGEDEYFVLADNRQGGADSRFFGIVKKSEILGTVITVLRRNNL